LPRFCGLYIHHRNSNFGFSANRPPPPVMKKGNGKS